MRVIGIDPGYDRLGVAVMEYDVSGREKVLYSGCIETDKDVDFVLRLQTIGLSFESLLKKYQPDTLAIETIFFNTNQKTAVMVAEARGVIIYLSLIFGCKIYEFGPQEIKVAVTGYGKSNKKAVVDMVKRLVSNAPKKGLDDEYDAIAIGVTCLAHYGRNQ